MFRGRQIVCYCERIRRIAEEIVTREEEESSLVIEGDGAGIGHVCLAHDCPRLRVDKNHLIQGILADNEKAISNCKPTQVFDVLCAGGPVNAFRVCAREEWVKKDCLLEHRFVALRDKVGEFRKTNLDLSLDGICIVNLEGRSCVRSYL